MAKILDGWTKTTLWFKRISDTEPLKFNVWSPPGCSDEDRMRLLEKNAGQVVSLIRKLGGDDAMIIQGQYKLDSASESGED